MIRPRASIAGLLVMTALLAVGFAALKVSSRLWAASFFSFALVCLVGSIAGLIYRQGPARAGFVGFALFGWTYLLAALGPPPLNVWREWLVSAPLLAILEDQLLEPPTQTVRTPPARAGQAIPRANLAFAELTPWLHWTQTDRSNPFSNDSFQRIGHSIFCIGIALMGGLLCRWLHGTRDQANRSSLDP